MRCSNHLLHMPLGREIKHSLGDMMTRKWFGMTMIPTALALSKGRLNAFGALLTLEGVDEDYDGVLDEDDNWIEQFNPVQTDYGGVGIDDLGDCLNALNSGSSPCDINADGGVGMDDIAIIIENLNTVPGPSGVVSD